MTTRSQTCINCSAFEPIPGNEPGICHLLPPSMIVTDVIEPYQPEVWPDDWCMEWMPSEARANVLALSERAAA